MNHNYFNLKHPKLILCLFLAGAILAAYWQISRHDFISYDDSAYVTKNRLVQRGLTWEGIKWSFDFLKKDGTYWHPFTWVSHMLDRELYGLNPQGHHWTNLILHMANSLLLFWMLNQMTGALWRSGVVAALFALHPLNVESVAWVAERKNVLSTFFWMLTLLTYAYYCRRPGFFKYMLTLLVFTLGLLAKPMLVTLPCVLLLLDYWPFGRIQFAPETADKDKKTNRFLSGDMVPTIFRLLLEKIPFLILSIVSVYLSSVSLQNQRIFVSMDSVPMKLRIANALLSYMSYIGKMIWPKNLAIFYPFPTTMPPMWQIAGSGLLLACLSVFVILLLKRVPYLTVGWLWYVGTLVPAIGLVQAGGWPAMADRWTYVPLVGLFIIIAWGVSDITARWRNRKIILVLFSGILFTVLIICTRFQVAHWQNSLTLFSHTVRVTDNNWLAHTRLGHALDEQGKPDEAIIQYNKALQINPGHVTARINLGIALARKGNTKEAVHHYNEALRTNPNDAGIYNNLGVISYNQGKTGAAIKHYRKALRINPKMKPALYNLSRIHATHENERYRDGVEAVRLAKRLCQLTDYKNPLFLDVLAAAYAESGKFEAAVSTIQTAYQLALAYHLEELAAGSKIRLEMYRKGHPFRQIPHRKNEASF